MYSIIKKLITDKYLNFIKFFHQNTEVDYIFPEQVSNIIEKLDTYIIEIKAVEYIWKNDFQGLRIFLENETLNINYDDGYMIKSAVLNKNMDILKLLLEYDADLSCENYYCIKKACEINHHEMITFICQQNIDLDTYKKVVMSLGGSGDFVLSQLKSIELKKKLDHDLNSEICFNRKRIKL